MNEVNSHERKVISQNNEDGIIEHIFNTIGTTNRFSVEIGIGRECNTGNLLNNHEWRGLMFDGDISTVIAARDWFPRALVLKAWVERDNVNELMEDAPAEPDLFSLDVDGIDYHLLAYLYAIDPRVVVVEYNASFGPSRSVTIPYIKEFNRMEYHPHYHGASLSAFTSLMRERGYVLVGCESSGINAFYVKKRLMVPPLAELSPADAYYPHRARGANWESQIRVLDQMNLKLLEV